MKKTIIALMGLFTLVACSDEAYLDSKDPNSNFGDTSVPSNPGDKTTYTNVSDYESPWEMTTLFQPVYYIFANFSSPSLVLKFTPYLGLAYFDGNNDGLYNNSSGLVANFTTGLYPNLYANGNEIGNFIPANPIIMNNSINSDLDFSIASNVTHCPVLDGNAGVTNGGQYFVINPSLANNMEQQLLADYGKVFFYKYELSHPSNPSVILKSGYVMPSCDELNPFGGWFATGIAVNIPSKTSPVDLYYHQSVSWEVILSKASGYPSSEIFKLGGKDHKIEYKTNPDYSELILRSY